jgi:hypothetical protein
MNYSEYLAENLDNTITYSEYLAENLDNTITYSEYIAENLDNYYRKNNIINENPIVKFKDYTKDFHFPNFDEFIKQNNKI